ncbi:MAG: ABC transporter permease subunit [Anaerolineae bacterium]|nr:ABC transporter permease subunit [Anaerolineae bacterium]
MKWNRINAIINKDLVEVRGNKSVWLPMIIVPAIFVFVLPLAMLWIPTRIEGAQESFTASGNDLGFFLNNLPASLAAPLQGLSDTQSMYVLMLGYILAPMFLIFPLMFSTIIASESFAGEYERKTIEALLYTPASDEELFLGKVLTAFIPSVLITWISFILYSLVLNIAGYPIFERIWFPFANWYPLIFWITPALAILGIAVTVLISARTRTFMGTYQTSASLVILVLGILGGQMSGVLYLTVETGLLLGLFFWLVAFGVSYLAIKSFNRARLLSGIKL